MKKSERFGMVLSPTTKQLLQHLASTERISEAAVVRRLIWLQAAKQRLAAERDCRCLVYCLSEEGNYVQD